MTRFFGAFIQNTLKPIIEELDKVLCRCERLMLDKQTIKDLMTMLIDAELVKIQHYCLLYFGLGIIFCVTIYMILK